MSLGDRVRAEKNCSGETERVIQPFGHDPDGTKRASAEEIVHLLTTLVRRGPFNEDVLASAFDDGVLHRAVDRMKALGAYGELELPRRLH